MEKYTYSISVNFPNGKVASDRLTEEIQTSAIVTALVYINTVDDQCDIWFVDVLSAPDQILLDGIVAVHSGEPIRDWIDVVYDPEMEPVEPGSSKVVANDRPAIQIEDGITGFFSMAGVWSLEQMTHAELKTTVKFIMQEVGLGDTVRLAIKAKSQATGEDSSSPFQYSGFVAVPINYNIIGQVFEGTIGISVPIFKENDALAVQIGRDGANIMGAGDNDNSDVAIQIISTKLEAR